MPAKKTLSDKSPKRPKKGTDSKPKRNARAAFDPALTIDLAETAISKWMISRTFSLAEVASHHNITLRELLLHFKNREELLAYYYESRWILFQTLKEQVPDYHGYTIEEKLSNLIYSLLDLMSPQKEFIRKTFSHYVLIPRELSGCSRMKSCTRRTPFHEAFNSEIRSMFSREEISKTSKVIVATPALELIWLSFLGIIRYWLQDTSKDGENTAALIDKFTAVLAELATSSLGDKMIDLGRFLMRELPLQSVWNPKDRTWKEWDYKTWGM